MLGPVGASQDFKKDWVAWAPSPKNWIPLDGVLKDWIAWAPSAKIGFRWIPWTISLHLQA